MDLQTVGEFEVAEQALRRAVDLSEGKPADRRKARFNLATVLVKLGRDDQAVPLLKDVVDADPGEVNARVKLGDSYLRTGDYEPAVQVLQEAVARDAKNKRAHLLLGKAFTRLGRHEEAGRHFQAFQDLEITDGASGEGSTP
jgi:Flp pilus assembly protein TadD